MEKFINVYKLSPKYAEILISDETRSNYFEKTVILAMKKGIEPNEIANVIVNKRQDINNLSPSALVSLLFKDKSKKAIEQQDLAKIIDRVIKENQQAVQDYCRGKKNAIDYLLGMVMRAAKGQAQPDQVKKILEKHLK